MITREQVADLQPGDVIEFRDDDWPGTVISGPLVSTAIGLCLGNFTIVRWANGEPNERSRATLTVVSRAPRPLYANHDRTEAIPGDVIRDEDGVIWLRDSHGKWQSADSVADDESLWWTTGPRPSLVIDGVTGQVVP